MMSNLNNNTTQLETLLAKVNALPEAGGGTDTSDATATADEIFAGETAYTADGKVTGTFTIDDELTEQNDLISQISTLVAQKANPSGGIDTSDATATSSDILDGKTAYVDGEKIAGNIPSKAAATYTPTTSNQTIASGQYLIGTQTIKGDANLIASNIKSGTSIFGVTGTYEGNGVSGGGGVETCTVSIICPESVSVFGWGVYDAFISANNGASWIALDTNSLMPSTQANSHWLPIFSKRVFTNLPVGSVFTFYLSTAIKSASISGDIEFSLSNNAGTGQTSYQFAMCRCNGDGEITIQV